MENADWQKQKYKWNDESLITKLQWKEILQDIRITEELDLNIILTVYNSPQNRTTATEIAKLLNGNNYRSISNRNVSYSRKVCNYLNISPHRNSNGGNRWWTLPYYGDPTGDGKYFYILRPELKDAIEELIAEGKINTVLQGRINDPIQDIEDFKINSEGLSKTESEALIKSRIGQGLFRIKLIKYWTKCCVTGCAKVEILKASHIKPWRISDNKERLDVFNGLLLVPNLDSAFDVGLISFDNNGKILICKALADDDRNKLGIQSELLLSKIEAQHIKYLEYHRENIFRHD